MRGLRHRRLIIAALLTVFVIGLVMGIVNGLEVSSSLLSLPGLLAMAPVGALLAEKRPHNPIGWLFLVTAALTSGVIWSSVVVRQTGTSPSEWHGAPVLALWFYNFAWFPVLVLGCVMVPLLFPEGWLSPRWRRFGISLIVWYSIFLAVMWVAPTLQADSGAQVPNPFSPEWLPELGDKFGNALGNLSALSLLVGAAGGVWCVGLRYWRGSVEERAQVRWFISAVLFVLLGPLLAGFGSREWVSDLALGIAAALFPIATWIAITRHGLYEIDRIISRTLAYAVVTGVVIATYAVLVTTITRLLPASSSTFAVTIATLCAAALFQPLLRVIRAFVDRRFNRAHYDALETIDSFADSLRTTIDTNTVHAHLGTAITRTLQPSSYTLWTRQ